MKPPIITITGDLASGKSSVGKLLESKTGWDLISIGRMQREFAVQARMDTNQFNQYMRDHPEFDDILDEKIRQLAETRQRIIIDSRWAWHLIPASVKIYISVDPEVAAQRVFNDKSRTAESYETVEAAGKYLIERKEKEVARLKEKHGVDYSDLGRFDMVVDSTLKPPEEVCAEIMRMLESFGMFE